MLNIFDQNLICQVVNNFRVIPRIPKTARLSTSASLNVHGQSYYRFACHECSPKLGDYSPKLNEGHPLGLQ